jgi:hypothetical protein
MTKRDVYLILILLVGNLCLGVRLDTAAEKRHQEVLCVQANRCEVGITFDDDGWEAKVIRPSPFNGELRPHSWDRVVMAGK